MVKLTEDDGRSPSGGAPPRARMTRKRWVLQIAAGALVLVAGIVLLVETAFPVQVPGLLWSALLVTGSAVFWYAFFASPSWWWAAIPGGALLGAATAPVMELDPAGSGQWTEVPFLAALSLGFWAVYLKDHRRWWAIIPAGALLTVAIVSGVTEVVDGAATGAILLFGLAITFLLVAALPTGLSKRWWALIVAAALTLLAVIVLLQSAELLVVLNYVWPIAVIGGGAYLLWSAWRRRHIEDDPSQPETTPTEPHPPGEPKAVE